MKICAAKKSLLRPKALSASTGCRWRGRLACEFAERPARTRPGGETPLELAAEDGCATITDNFGMHRKVLGRAFWGFSSARLLPWWGTERFPL
ncbi:MAG: hypothetical protein HY735_19150 [Verrucomicrobia bacterium]|nr:hypothetical protein [Verrucomicrobiota bacterium]